jgi:antitoxin protein of toxin-antitoxin system
MRTRQDVCPQPQTEEKLMGLDEIKDKVTGGATEKASDAGIEKAGDAVEAKTGGKGAEQIEKGERAADAKIGE